MLARRMLMFGVILTFGALAPSLSAQTVNDNAPQGMKLVEMAIESISIELLTNSVGDITRVTVKPCVNCMSKSFQTGSNFRIFAGEKLLPKTSVLKWNRSPGTVFIDTETGVANKVTFFNSAGGDGL